MGSGGQPQQPAGSPQDTGLPTAADIHAAAARIAGKVRRTPVLTVGPGEIAPAGAVLKLELLQYSGSFKARGAFNRLLTADVPRAGVIAASGGNHGLAVAHAARTLAVPAEVFVPESTPAVKVDRLRAYGAEVTVTGAFYADALEASERRRAETGALLVHAYDQPAVVAGQGTVAVELETQAQMDTVLVGVGGAGLIGGIATWLGGRVRVVGVEPAACPTLYAALGAGHPVDVGVGGVAADSMGARRVGELGFAAAQHFVDRVVLVEDEAIVAAQRSLWSVCRLVAEPGGAAAVAALASGAYQPDADERVAVVVCGSNTDPASVA